MMTRFHAELREMVSEQIQYRELLLQMTRRDFLLRYKQTAMGFLWAIFMPLVNTAIFSIIFTRVAPIDVGVPYPIFAYCGLFTWNFFSSTLRFAVISLTSNPNLVTKVYFPREIFPFSAVIVCLLDFAVAGVVLLGLLVYYRIPPTGALVYLPLVLAVHVMFTTAMALVVAMGNLFYRDVKYVFEIVLTVWMFVTSVLYPIGMVGGRLGTAMQLNPMTPIIDGYRAVLLYGASPVTPSFAAAMAVAIILFGGSWIVFHRAEFAFAENV